MREFKNENAEFIPYLRRYARALTGDFPLADKLVQQSFDCALGLRHLFKDKLKTEKKIRLFSIFHLIHNDYINGQKNFPVVDGSYSTHLSIVNFQSVEDKFRNDKYYLAFLQLPLPQKQVLLLVTVERFLYDEVSKILNMPLGAILSQLHTARKSIAEKVYSRNTALPVVHNENISESEHNAAEMSL